MISVPTLISQLLEDESVAPIVYHLGDDSYLEEVEPEDIDFALRIEIWVWKANQYVYSERNSTDKEWSAPKFGEHPFDQVEVSSVDEIATLLNKMRNETQFLLDTDAEWKAFVEEVHPMVRKWL